MVARNFGQNTWWQAHSSSSSSLWQHSGDGILTDAIAFLCTIRDLCCWRLVDVHSAWTKDQKDRMVMPLEIVAECAQAVEEGTPCGLSLIPRTQPRSAIRPQRRS